MDKEEKLKSEVAQVKSNTSKDLALLIDQTPCFGVLWEDENGVCPENQCLLRAHCERVFTEVHEPDPTEVDAIEMEDVRPKKYQRAGYNSLGRHVDNIIRLFVHSMGYPKVLEKNWSHKKMKQYGYSDRVMLSIATSYHSLIVDKKMVLRMWSNASSFSAVEITTALAQKAPSYGFSVTPIPTESLEKSKPCKFRLYCETVEDAENLAKLVKAVYDV